VLSTGFQPSWLIEPGFELVLASTTCALLYSLSWRKFVRVGHTAFRQMFLAAG
jgi:hypothetical protein